MNASGLVTAAHAPVLTTTNSANDLLRQTAAIRSMEGGAGYYMGLMALGDTTEAGRTLGLSSGPSMVSIPDARIMAHELGHSLSLLHPPGEAPPVDVTYPHTDRVTGSWGYDFRDDGTLVSPDTYDLMSYGRPGWIGDYHYGKALRFRRTSERATTARADTPRQSLLLWGGIDAGGELYLDPAFIVEASPKLPDSAGEYRLTGRSDGGGELFDVDFSISIPEDGGGQATFVFFLPVESGWEDGLASISLSGPGGSVSVDAESDQPMVILRDSTTGRVRGFFRDLADPSLVRSGALRAPSAFADAGLEVLFSRGIPAVDAWGR